MGVLAFMFELSRSYLLPAGGEWAAAWRDLLGKACPLGFPV